MIAEERPQRCPLRRYRRVAIGWPGVSVDDHAAVSRLLVKRHCDTVQLRAKQIACVSPAADRASSWRASNESNAGTGSGAPCGHVAATDEVTRCRVLMAQHLLGDIAQLDDTRVGARRARRAQRRWLAAICMAAVWRKGAQRLHRTDSTG